jgi:hypothetical protein
MGKRNMFIGLDVHNGTIDVSLAEDPRTVRQEMAGGDLPSVH